MADRVNRDDQQPILLHGAAKPRKRQHKQLREPVPTEIQELFRALEKISVGQRDQVDAVRLLEIWLMLRDRRAGYWASLALELANQAARP